MYVKMMKIYLFLAVVMALTSAFPCFGREAPTAAISKKLQNVYDQSGKTNKDVKEKISLEDYHPIDPSPSKKASTNSGPIEHGTPLIPYIPQPSPPSHPKHLGP